MTTKPNTISWGCLLMWIFATLIAVLVGFAVFFVVMSALGASMTIIPDLAASLIMTGCFGSVIGLAQWSILRQYVQRSAVWIPVTLLGFLIVSPVLLSKSGGFGPNISSQASFVMTTALGGALGVAQWFAIYKKVKRSALWIGISVMSWMIAGLIGIFLKTLNWEMGPILYWIGLFFIGTALSVAGLMWLLKPTNPSAQF